MKPASVETFPQPEATRTAMRPKRPHAKAGSATRSWATQEDAPMGSAKEEVTARWSERRKVMSYVATLQQEASTLRGRGATR